MATLKELAEREAQRSLQKEATKRSSGASRDFSPDNPLPLGNTPYSRAGIAYEDFPRNGKDVGDKGMADEPLFDEAGNFIDPNAGKGKASVTETISKKSSGGGEPSGGDVDWGKLLKTLNEPWVYKVAAGLSKAEGDRLQPGTEHGMGGYQDIAMAHLDTAKNRQAELEKERELEQKQAELAEKKRQADMDYRAKIMKAGDGSAQKDLRPLGFEALAKYTASKEASRQLEESVLPLLETSEGQEKIKNYWVNPASINDPEAQQFRTSYLNAAEAIIRAESGAAVPDTEIIRMAKRYEPKPWDSPEQVRAKINNVYQRGVRLTSATEKLYKTGQEPTVAKTVGAPEVKAAGDTATATPSGAGMTVGKYKILGVK